MAKRKGQKWEPADYTPFFLLQEPRHTEAEIKREYTRMRDMMVKRAKRLEEIGLKTQAAYIREQLPTLKEMRAQHEAQPARVSTGRRDKKGKIVYREVSWKEQVARSLAGARSLEITPAYSVKGVKEIQRQQREELGEDVPIEDVLPFAAYMKSWRMSAFSKTMVGSGEAQDLYNTEYQEDENRRSGNDFASFYTLYHMETYGKAPGA